MLYHTTKTNNMGNYMHIFEPQSMTQGTFGIRNEIHKLIFKCTPAEILGNHQSL